jgi:DNA primase
LKCRYRLASSRPRQGRISLEEAKDRLTIPILWARLSLPGKSGESCRSPFREDRKPSFSVYDNGKRWKDHATGEGGDAADFLAHALDVSPEEGCRKLIELAGGRQRVPCHAPAPRAIHRAAAAADIEKTAKRAGWPPFEKPTGANPARAALGL